MKKQPEITEHTKECLINAFWQLYCKKSIEKITVKDITTIAGYNRSTFYEYFTDVYDVLTQIENSLLPTMDALPPTDFSNSSEQLRIVIDMYEKNSKYYVVLLGDNGDPAFQSKMKSRIKPMLLQAFGAKSSLPEAEFDYVLEFILSAMLGVLSYWYRQEKPLPIEKLVNLINNLCKNEIVSQLMN